MTVYCSGELSADSELFDFIRNNDISAKFISFDTKEHMEEYYNAENADIRKDYKKYITDSIRFNQE